MNTQGCLMNKGIYDKCYLEQKSKSNGSIFDYYTDNSMYINKNKCNDFTPPFISYIPIGVNEKNIHLENELKGITRNTSLCASAKYIPADSNLVERVDKVVVDKSAKDCESSFKILPNGYISVVSPTRDEK
jgi:hypothetical protein